MIGAGEASEVIADNGVTPASEPGATRSRVYRAEAVVLRRMDVGEADRIVTVYTDRHGKLRLVAKGVRRTQSRLAGHLEPFARSSLLIARARNLDIVTQASLTEPYRNLRQREQLIAYAGYLGDLLDSLTPDAEPNRAIFELLIASLGLLDQGSDPFFVARWFEVQLLSLVGFRPELYRCLACDRALEPVKNGFSPAGGVLCPDCLADDPLALPVSVNALKFLRLLDRGELTTAFRLRVAPGLRGEIASLLESYIRVLLDRELGSLAVLRVVED